MRLNRAFNFILIAVLCLHEVISFEFSSVSSYFQNSLSYMSKISNNPLLKEEINDLTKKIQDSEISKEIISIIPQVTSIKSNFVDTFTELQDKMTSQQALLLSWIGEITGINIPEELLYIFVQTEVIAVLLFSYGVTSYLADKNKISQAPYDVGSNSYSVEKADLFYNERPLLVASRLFQLAVLTSNFNIKLLLDWRLGNLEKNEKVRAKEALKLSTQLGPTFIKLGQALSIRTDLIPEAYALELRQLQDAVPPFDSEEAKEIIRNEFKVNNLNEIFTKLTDKPIASASIGQVYKGTLKTGEEVAVKVQRPGILGEIALDLYLLRLLTPLQVKLSNWINKRSTAQEDIDVSLSLVDEWGRGFVAEVDYRTEAFNTIQFSNAMKNRGLDAVTAPDIVNQFTGKRVITTSWMEGTRLDRDASPDVPRLCGVAVNAYLTMLLDTGVLHCDPHPGNLLRTKDGKLCILDWGMTLQVPQNLQYALLEFISHVISEDYDAMPNDFINLGFSPGDKLPQLKSSGLTEGLAFALRQLKRGGGPKKIQERVKEEFVSRYGEGLTDLELQKRARAEMIERMQKQLKSEGVDVNDVTGVMEEMSRRNRELFKLPPYVLYVSRAFSTLEGIGLSINEDYAILQECYPYLAKRLFTDDSPRAQLALKTMLYGAGAASQTDTALSFSPDKLIEMSEGFSSYTSATGSTDDNKGAILAQEALVDLLLSEKGNFIQSTILDETVKFLDATVRDNFSKAKETAPAKFMVSFLETQNNLADNLSKVPIFGALALPGKVPLDMFNSISALLDKSEEDEISLALAEKILQELNNREVLKSISSSSSSSSSGGVSLPSVSDLQKWLLDPDSVLRKSLLNENLRNQVVPKIGVISAKFGSRLLHRVSNRLESRLNSFETTQPISSSSGGPLGDAFSGKTIVKSVTGLSISSARNVAKALENSNKKNQKQLSQLGPSSD